MILSIFLSPIVLSGQLSDRYWMMGYNEYPGVPGYGHTVVQFPSGEAVQTISASLAFNFESTAAVAADTQGELLFYSNGCEIANRNHEIMPNGTGLNPGEMSDRVCSQTGYILPQGAMAIPAPGKPDHYYLLHSGAAYEPARKLIRGPLYYTEVDMTLENGLGDVVSKNNILLEEDLSAFTVIRHGNGRDWWVIVPEFGNKTWYTFLLSPKGFEAMPPQDVSLMLPGCEHHEATVASLDGSRIANWGDCKVSVLRFDRCAGALSDLQELDAPAHWFPGGGLSFSASGRYLYATSHNVLHRADLDAVLPKLDTMRFSFAPSGQSPYDVPGNTFHYMVNAPDGYIYGNIPSRARFLHVLESPDEENKADIDFVPQGLSLPVTCVRTLPYFPNFRLLDVPESLCDTLGINMPTEVSDPEQKLDWKVSLAPNPAGETLHLQTESAIETLQVFDATGREMRSFSVTPSIKGATVHIRQLPGGLYYLVLHLKDRVWSGKFVKR
ncbi:MAG: T9SS type A sorting domain-containing protein [Saprospiraceae bacterium]|nr:T9SS type A sorting domain-containing protein [Saprospiraceae bacterium]